MRTQKEIFLSGADYMALQAENHFGEHITGFIANSYLLAAITLTSAAQMVEDSELGNSYIPKNFNMGEIVI